MPATYHVQIVLKSGTTVTFQAAEFRTSIDPATNKLTNIEWEKAERQRLAYVDLDEIVAIVVDDATGA